MAERHLPGHPGEQVDPQGSDPEDGDEGQELHPVVVAQEVRIQGDVGGERDQGDQDEEQTEDDLPGHRGHQGLIAGVGGVEKWPAPHTRLTSPVPKMP